MMNEEFDRRFRTLLSTWVQHHELRRTGAPVSELFHSRRRLDEARTAVAVVRRGV